MNSHSVLAQPLKTYECCAVVKYLRIILKEAF